MSELLKSIEQNQNTEPNGWESLQEVKFNPDRTQSKQTESVTSLKSAQESKSSSLKSVSELSPAEASQEYLDLLMELGQNFTSPEGKASRVVNGNGEIVNQSYNSDEKFINKMLGTHDAAASDDKYLDRALNLHMVDKIIGAEMMWQQSGKDYEAATAQLEEAKEALQKYTEDDSKLGIFKKIFTFRKRGKERKALQADVDTAQSLQKKAKDNIGTANSRLGYNLNSAYSEDYEYGHHKFSFDHEQEKGYGERVNKEYNETFFSNDRMDKINRAIELRKQLAKNPKTNPDSL